MLLVFILDFAPISVKYETNYYRFKQAVDATHLQHLWSVTSRSKEEDETEFQQLDISKKEWCKDVEAEDPPAAVQTALMEMKITQCQGTSLYSLC